MPGKQIAPGKLVSTMLALVRPIARVCVGRERDEKSWVGWRTDGISCGVRHVEDE